MNPETRTKTGRARLARQARKGGYFHDQKKFEISVKCPLCDDKVVAVEPRRDESTTKALDSAMDTHLLFDCQYGPQQQ